MFEAFSPEDASGRACTHASFCFATSLPSIALSLADVTEPSCAACATSERMFKLSALRSRRVPGAKVTGDAFIMSQPM